MTSFSVIVNASVLLNFFMSLRICLEPIWGFLRFIKTLYHRHLWSKSLVISGEWGIAPVCLCLRRFSALIPVTWRKVANSSYSSVISLSGGLPVLVAWNVSCRRSLIFAWIFLAFMSFLILELYFLVILGSEVGRSVMCIL